MSMPEHKSATRWQIFEDYCHHAPNLDELPLLLDALGHEDYVVLRAAARSIAKLGHAGEAGSMPRAGRTPTCCCHRLTARPWMPSFR